MTRSRRTTRKPGSRASTSAVSTRLACPACAAPRSARVTVAPSPASRVSRSDPHPRHHPARTASHPPPLPRYLFLRRRSAPCFRQRQRGRLVLHRKPHQAGDVREDGARSRGGRGRPMRPAPGVLEARRGAVIKRRMPHASTTYLTADRPAPRLARFVTLQYMFLGAGSGNTLYVFLLHQSAWQSQQCAAAQTLPLHNTDLLTGCHKRPHVLKRAGTADGRTAGDTPRSPPSPCA